MSKRGEKPKKKMRATLDGNIRIVRVGVSRKMRPTLCNNSVI